MMTMCEHVYKNMNVSLCPKCGLDTHEINWVYQNESNAEWLAANPNAEYQGWMSI